MLWRTVKSSKTGVVTLAFREDWLFKRVVNEDGTTVWYRDAAASRTPEEAKRKFHSMTRDDEILWIPHDWMQPDSVWSCYGRRQSA